MKDAVSEINLLEVKKKKLLKMFTEYTFSNTNCTDFFFLNIEKSFKCVLANTEG